MMKLRNILLIIVSPVIFILSTTKALSQELPIACPGYKPGKVQLIGERAGRKLSAAFDAYNENNTAEAIEVLRGINAKDPFDKATVDRFLGQLLVTEDNQEQEAYERLLRAAEADVLNDNDQVQLMLLVADFSMQLEKYDAALAWYDKWLIKTCKEEPRTYIRIAKALTELKRYNDVIEPANKAISSADKPDKNPHVLKLNAYVETKNFPKAVEVSETLVTLFPAEKLWWSQLGMMYMMTENYPKALQTFSLAYRQGMLSKKSEIQALYQLYAQSDVPINGAKILSRYIETGLFDKTHKEYSSLANIYHQAKEFDKAASYYGRAAAMEPDPDYYLKQGNLLLNVEDYRGAIDALTQALDAGISDPERVHFSLMQANYYNGNYRKAHEHAVASRKDASLRRNANAWIAIIKNKAKNRGITI